MEAYVTGVSKGTTPTTFSPNDTVTRVQMTTFLQRSLDQGSRARAGGRRSISGGSRRTSTRCSDRVAGTTICAPTVEIHLGGVHLFGQVAQVQASTGNNPGNLDQRNLPPALCVAAGKIFVAGDTSPGNLYLIDPTQPPGAVTVAATGLGNQPLSIAFDGTNLWTANYLAARCRSSQFLPQRRTR